MSFSEFRFEPKPLYMINYLCPAPRTAVPSYTRTFQYQYHSRLSTIRSAPASYSSSVPLLQGKLVDKTPDRGRPYSGQSSIPLAGVTTLATPELREDEVREQAGFSDHEGEQSSRFEEVQSLGQPTLDSQTFPEGSCTPTLKRGRGRPPTRTKYSRKVAAPCIRRGVNIEYSYAQEEADGAKQNRMAIRRGSGQQQYAGRGDSTKQGCAGPLRRGRGRPPKDNLKARRGPGRPRKTASRVFGKEELSTSGRIRKGPNNRKVT